MVKVDEKEEAIKLRRNGLSYSEILEHVDVAKSTLSLWLHSVKLAKSQKQRLTKKKMDAARRGSDKVHAKRLEIWKTTKEASAKSILNLCSKDRLLVGAALYWAEGSKEKEYIGRSTSIKFSNSDPSMIILFRKWLREFFNISATAITYELYIHETADINSSKRWWADKLEINENCIRVYLKRNKINSIRKNSGNNYHGLIRMYVPSSTMSTRVISGWIDGICERWGVV